MDGYKIAVEAMKGTSLEFLNATKPFLTWCLPIAGEPLAPLDPKTLEQGASTTLYAALAPELEGKTLPLCFRAVLTFTQNTVELSWRIAQTVLQLCLSMQRGRRNKRCFGRWARSWLERSLSMRREVAMCIGLGQNQSEVGGILEQLDSIIESVKHLLLQLLFNSVPQQSLNQTQMRWKPQGKCKLEVQKTKPLRFHSQLIKPHTADHSSPRHNSATSRKTSLCHR